MTEPNPLDAFQPKPHPLKAQLEARSMAQATAAKFCGVSISHFRDVLNGHAAPSAHLAAKLAEAASLLGRDAPE